MAGKIYDMKYNQAINDISSFILNNKEEKSVFYSDELDSILQIVAIHSTVKSDKIYDMFCNLVDYINNLDIDLVAIDKALMESPEKREVYISFPMHDTLNDPIWRETYVSRIKMYIYHIKKQFQDRSITPNDLFIFYNAICYFREFNCSKFDCNQPFEVFNEELDKYEEAECILMPYIDLSQLYQMQTIKKDFLLRKANKLPKQYIQANLDHSYSLLDSNKYSVLKGSPSFRQY